MRIPEVDDPGSVAYTQRAQRKKRNDALLDHYAEDVAECLRGRISVDKYLLETHVQDVVWHPYEMWLAGWNKDRIE